jgi:signal transduction histidine kinase
VIHAEATRLSTLYSVARPACRTRRREAQQAFRTAFAQATGKPYHPYGHPKTAKERTTITAWWDEALRTALARFQASGELDALDAVLVCLPAWADRRHERWSTQGWREPSVKEVMQLITDYLMVCEACLETIAQVAAAAVAQAPGVERAQVAPDVEQRYGEQVHTLRARIGAFAIPTDTPRAQKAQLRREKTQLQQALHTLLSAQEVEITRHVKQSATARHKLETLVKTVSGYSDMLWRKLGKASVDVLPRMIWIYDFERQGDDDWRAAKRDARRFLRQVRQGSGTPVAGEAP